MEYPMFRNTNICGVLITNLVRRQATTIAVKS